MKRSFLKCLICVALCLTLLLAAGCSEIFDRLEDGLPNLGGGGAKGTDPQAPARTDAPLEGELLPTTGTFLYGKSVAEGNVQHVYNLLEEHVLRTIPSNQIELSLDLGVTENEAKEAVEWFCADHPEAFWFEGGYRYFLTEECVTKLEFTYLFEGDGLDAAREALEQEMELILKELPEDADAYEKALYLHDAVADRVTYEQVGHHQTAYGALVDGKAVCAGYAAAYQLLLQRAGISACTVTGYSQNPGLQDFNAAPERHAWNAVWLDENTCVYTDVTWDDQGDLVYHYYFNLSLKEIDEDHTRDSMFAFPKCEHDRFSYFDRNDHLVIDFTSTGEEVAPLFECYQLGKWHAVLYYNDGDFDGWMSAHFVEIYQNVSGLNGGCSVHWSNLGKEYYVVLD